MNSLIIGKMRIALFLMVTCFLSCGPDPRTYIYTVRNESGVKVKIIGYVRNRNEEYIIDLNHEKELTQTYCDGLPPRGYSWPFFYGSANGWYVADSIKIIYNNTKYKIFNYENINDARNPLSKFNPILTEGLFIFTQEDYEKAVDCNGDCE